MSDMNGQRSILSLPTISTPISSFLKTEIEGTAVSEAFVLEIFTLRAFIQCLFSAEDKSLTVQLQISSKAKIRKYE